MLNDLRPPPLEPSDDSDPAVTHASHRSHAPSHANGRHIAPHTERMDLGKHHTRYMGDPTQTDPLYAMPFEERGSGFNITMTLVALALFAVLILMAWWTLG